MQVGPHQALIDLHAIADVGADHFEQSIAALPSVLASVLEQIASDFATGTFPPQPEVVTLKEDLTIIQIRTNRTGNNSYQQEIALKINTIFGFLNGGIAAPCAAKIYSLLIGSDLLGVEGFWLNNYITVSEEGALSFSAKLSALLDLELFAYILTHTNIKRQKSISSFSMSQYPFLGPEAARHLLNSCPNLRYSSFSDMPTTMYDHQLVVNDHQIPVNKAILMHASPYFAALWQPGMKEGADTTGKTVLRDVDVATLQNCMNLVIGKTWELNQLHINDFLSILELLNCYFLLDKKEIEDRFEELFIQFLETHKAELVEKKLALNLLNAFHPTFTANKCSQIKSCFATIYAKFLKELPIVIRYDELLPLVEEVKPFLFLLLDVAERERREKIVIVLETAILTLPDSDPEKERYTHGVNGLKKKEFGVFSFERNFNTSARYDSAKMHLVRQMGSLSSQEVSRSLDHFYIFLQNSIEGSPNFIHILSALQPVLCSNYSISANRTLCTIIEKQITSQIIQGACNIGCLLEQPFVQEHLIEILDPVSDYRCITRASNAPFNQTIIKNIIAALDGCITILSQEQIHVKTGEGYELTEEKRIDLVNDLQLNSAIFLQFLEDPKAKEKAKMIFAHLRAVNNIYIEHTATLHLANLLRLEGNYIAAKELLTHDFCQRDSGANRLKAQILIEDEKNLAAALALARNNPDLRQCLEQYISPETQEKLASGDRAFISFFFQKLLYYRIYLKGDTNFHWYLTPFTSIYRDFLRKIPKEHIPTNLLLNLDQIFPHLNCDIGVM